jgi:hypothetical protein
MGTQFMENIPILGHLQFDFAVTTPPPTTQPASSK